MDLETENAQLKAKMHILQSEYKSQIEILQAQVNALAEKITQLETQLEQNQNDTSDNGGVIQRTVAPRRPGRTRL